MRSAPRRPMRARWAGSRASPASAAARARASRSAARKPVSPSSTTAGTPPTRVATTGRSAASASIAATGVPSFADVRRRASNAACHSERNGAPAPLAEGAEGRDEQVRLLDGREPADPAHDEAPAGADLRPDAVAERSGRVDAAGEVEAVRNHGEALRGRDLPGDE